MDKIKLLKSGIAIFAVLLLLLEMSVASFAHSGRTDSRGGHKDNIHGGYHYHHGFSAHDHPNGICPYRTNDNSNNKTTENASTTTTNRKIPFSTEAITEEKEEKPFISESVAEIIMPIFLVGGLLFYAFLAIKYRK